MGYRDDFYVAENIIGYTGDVGSNPSVYFRSGSEWGRITQDHDKKTNIGRAFVRDTMPYTIVNETRVIKGEQKEVSVEYVNGEEHHVSRNKFFPVSDENRDALAFAIKAFHHVRARHEKYVSGGVALTNATYADYFDNESDWTAS